MKVLDKSTTISTAKLTGKTEGKATIKGYVKMSIKAYAKINREKIPNTLKGRTKFETIGLRIKHEAATDAKKLHIVHSSNQWKIIPENSDISLYNSKSKKKVISFGKSLLEKYQYSALVEHSIEGYILGYIVRDASVKSAATIHIPNKRIPKSTSFHLKK
jgi:hypothetical protein